MTVEQADPASTARNWHLRGDASSRQLLAGARRGLRAWLGTWVGAADADDITLACWEALANVRDHAYGHRGGQVEVWAHVRDEVLTVAVRDKGQWRPAGAHSGQGRGFLLIQAVADMVDLTSPGGGTTVTMSWQLGTHRRVPPDDRSDTPTLAVAANDASSTGHAAVHTP